MREKNLRSEELRERIVKDRGLLNELSETISEILKDNVKLEGDETYAFIPIVFKKPIFAPEIFTSDYAIERIPFGGAGPMDPDILKTLEKYRIKADDPVPIRSLREQILSNRSLLKRLSEGISKVFKDYGVKFETDETYAFLPIEFKKPVFSPEPVPWIPQGANIFTDIPLVMLGPQPEPPDHPALLSQISTIAMIEKYGIIPRPLPGPLDPWLLDVLEKYRIDGIKKMR